MIDQTRLIMHRSFPVIFTGWDLYSRRRFFGFVRRLGSRVQELELNRCQGGVIDQKKAKVRGM
jgi:hypothetical protein